jgi:hypothetical protein
MGLALQKRSGGKRVMYNRLVNHFPVCAHPLTRRTLARIKGIETWLKSAGGRLTATRRTLARLKGIET